MTAKFPFSRATGLRLVAGSLLMCSSPLWADIQVQGFANIVAGTTLDDDNTVRGYDEDFAFDRDSLFGVQFTSDLSDGLSATVQMVARGRDDWDAEFTWAYMNYELSDNSSIQFGRVRIPFYKYSEFLEVGYAYHWMTPPASVYDLPLNNQEGIAYTYNSTIGSFDSSLQFVVGRLNEEIAFEVDPAQDIFDGEVDGFDRRDSDGRNNTSFVWSLTDFTWSFRLGYTFCGDCTLGLPTDDFAQQIALQAPQFLDAMLAVENDVSFGNIGLRYSGESWFTEIEYARFSGDDSLIPEETDSAYWTIGFNTDTSVFHFTYEFEEADPRTVDEITGGAAIPGALATAIAGVAEAFREDSETMTIGWRYDFHRSAAFKLDISRIDNNLTGESYDLITTGVSLVF